MITTSGSADGAELELMAAPATSSRCPISVATGFTSPRSVASKLSMGQTIVVLSCEVVTRYLLSALIVTDSTASLWPSSDSFPRPFASARLQIPPKSRTAVPHSPRQVGALFYALFRGGGLARTRLVGR